MREITVSEILALGQEMSSIKTTLSFDEIEGKPPDATWMISHLRNLAGLAERAGLETSHRLLSERMANPPKSEREYEFVEQVLRIELAKPRLFALPADRAKCWNATWLSAPAQQVFPGAEAELKLAGNSYAVGLAIASVFHSARAMEIGTRMLAIALECRFDADEKPLEQAMLAIILNKCESRIREIEREKQAPGKGERLSIFARAASHFRVFKDAVRVQVAHARQGFSDAQAIETLQSVRSFMDDLGPHLDRPVPKAKLIPVKAADT